MVVILVLTANVTMPMNPFSLRLPESFKNIMESRRPEILSIGNQCSLGILTVQSTLFLLLKRENALFGTELISVNKKDLIEGVTVIGTCLAALIATIDTLSLDCIHPYFNNGINILLALSTMGHMSNLIYDDALKLIKQKFKKLPPELTIKNRVNVATLDNGRCLICLDDKLSEYVNPCEQADHIFCKNCLELCLVAQKEKPSFKEKKSFLCELCRKEVSFNDEKFEIVLPDEPKVTCGLWAKQVGFSSAIFYVVQFFLLMSILQCQFS